MFKCAVCGQANRRAISFDPPFGTTGMCTECHPRYCAICFSKVNENEPNYYFNSTAVRLCTKCKTKMAYCRNCGAYVVDPEGRTGILSQCDNCMNAYEVCGNCGKVMPQQPIMLNEDRGGCCRAQYKKYSHDYKPDRFYMNGDQNSREFYGIELEFPLPYGVDEARWVHEFMKLMNSGFPTRDGVGRHLYIKHDGSIGHGFEVVLQPHTYDALVQFPWHLIKEFGDLFNLEKYMQWHSNIGMHIHISKGAFTKLQLFKFSQFLIQNRGFTAFIGERELNRYCGSFNGYLAEKIVKGYGSHEERYSLVNLANEFTVELRFMMSTTNPDIIWKNLQFTRTLQLFCKESGLKDWKVSQYLDFVKQYGNKMKDTRYAIPQLLSFLESWDGEDNDTDEFGTYVKRRKGKNSNQWTLTDPGGVVRQEIYRAQTNETQEQRRLRETRMEAVRQLMEDVPIWRRVYLNNTDITTNRGA